MHINHIVSHSDGAQIVKQHHYVILFDFDMGYISKIQTQELRKNGNVVFGINFFYVMIMRNNLVFANLFVKKDVTKVNIAMNS